MVETGPVRVGDDFFAASAATFAFASAFAFAASAATFAFASAAALRRSCSTAFLMLLLMFEVGLVCGEAGARDILNVCGVVSPFACSLASRLIFNRLAFFASVTKIAAFAAAFASAAAAILAAFACSTAFDAANIIRECSSIALFASSFAAAEDAAAPVGVVADIPAK